MTKKILNIDPEKIHLNGIEEVEVSLDNSFNFNKSQPELSSGIAHTTGYILEKKKFLFGLELIFSTEEEVLQDCKFRFNFHFKIDNLDEMYELNEENNPVFKKLFVATLAGISYSTLRGIVFEKTKNSNCRGLVLPVINPSTLLDSWIDKN